MQVFFAYLFINILFNFNLFWKELFIDSSKIGAVWGEVQAYEWLTDKFYQTFIHGGNPFEVVKNMLYPFGLSLGLVDAGNAIYFILLRPFFSIHQTMSAVIILSLLLANLGMYLLLRKLKINQFIAFIIGAAYGYTTFLMPRGGHLSYWCHYLFPWFYYCSINLVINKDKRIKIASSVGVAFFFVMTLWSNFYYFIILLLSIFSFILYFLIEERKIILNKIKEVWHFLLFTFFSIVLFLIPWFIALYNQIFFDVLPKTEGWGGAIQFSADIINYFIPSEYGYYVTKYPFLIKPVYFIVRLLVPNISPIFENFTYPGVIILISYFFLFIFSKKLNKKIKKNIKPFLIISILFFLLTLGPFLHVFGHWGLTVDEGIRIVIPLPYIVFHYLPFMSNIRVPGRLVVGFIFFAYIVSAYVVNDLLRNKSKKVRTFIIASLFLIFILDHRYYVSTDSVPRQIYPYRIYEEIKKDKSFFSVLEIPFTVRDGFTYFGDQSAFQMIEGESIFNKPVLGGYTGRIANYKKKYYQDNPFLGYIGRLIDGDLLINPGIEKNNLKDWNQINLIKSEEAVNFLDLKYIVINNEKHYSASVSAILKDLGYFKRKNDKQFTLWSRILEKKEFLSIDLNNKLDITFLGFGWHDPEKDYRLVDRKSSTMFKLNSVRPMILNFQVEAFYKEQPLIIYINKKKVAKLNIKTKKQNYSIPISKDLDKGINTIYFVFDRYYRPFDVIPNSLDKRQLAAKFYQLYLSEKN